MGAGAPITSLAKAALNRLAAAAALSWVPAECRALEEERDERGLLVRLVYRAAGELRTAGGELRLVTGEKEFDLRAIEEGEYQANLKKARERAARALRLLEGLEPAGWARLRTDASLREWRKHLRARAETGAKLRVLREALGLRLCYSLEELRHPFIVCAHELRPAALEAALERAASARGSGLRNWGAGPYPIPQRSLRLILSPQLESQKPPEPSDQGPESSTTAFPCPLGPSESAQAPLRPQLEAQPESTGLYRLIVRQEPGADSSGELAAGQAALPDRGGGRGQVGLASKAPGPAPREAREYEACLLGRSAMLLAQL